MGKKSANRHQFTVDEVGALGFEGVIDNDFSSHFTSPPVCVRVGPERAAYYLHRDLLHARCPYFGQRASFYEKSSAQVQEDIVLEHIDCKVFNFVIDYLYHQKIVLPNISDLNTLCDLVVHLYLLGDMFLMDDPKRVALSQMSDLLKNNYLPCRRSSLLPDDIVRLLRIVYDGTMADVQPDEVLDEIARPADEDERQDEVAVAYDNGDMPDSIPELDTWDVTTSELRMNEKPPVGFGQVEQATTCDGMRDLLARFAASKLVTLKSNPAFRKLILEDANIGIDLLSHAQACVFH